MTRLPGASDLAQRLHGDFVGETQGWPEPRVVLAALEAARSAVPPPLSPLPCRSWRATLEASVADALPLRAGCQRRPDPLA